MAGSATVVSDRQLEIAFSGSDFGRRDHRTLLEISVLKRAVDYHCGWTITQIMMDLRLIGKTGKVTKKGKEFLRDAYASRRRARNFFATHTTTS